MSDFGDLLERSVFVLQLPRPDSTDSAVSRGDGGRRSGARGASPVPPDAAAAGPAAVVPPPGAAASHPDTSGGYRAVVFAQLHSDTVDGRGPVEPRRSVTVSCCLCPSAIRLLASGFGEMARGVEAAGWHYVPGRHLHDRAWCPRCRPNAGKAVA